MAFNITKAISTDAERLTEIAWHSKSYWNYPKEWMELWRKDLTISEELIKKKDVFKLVLEDGEIIGCTALNTEKDILWIDHLWLLPKYIGNGFGRKLLKTAIDQTLVIDSYHHPTQFASHSISSSHFANRENGNL